MLLMPTLKIDINIVDNRLYVQNENMKNSYSYIWQKIDKESLYNNVTFSGKFMFSPVLIRIHPFPNTWIICEYIFLKNGCIGFGGHGRKNLWFILKCSKKRDWHGPNYYL